MRPTAWALTLALSAAVLSGPSLGDASGETKPQRIVSMNLCTDQLVMLLADPGRILSLSYLAANPDSSTLAERARAFGVNHGLAEEILPLAPDLVVAGSFTTRPTVLLLRRLGRNLIEVPVASSLADVRRNVRLVGKAVGETDRAEAMIADFDRRLAAGDGFSGPRPQIALYWANGFTSGQETLANAIVEAAGLRNLGADLGVTGSFQLPLETLLLSSPRLLVSDWGQDRSDGLSEWVFRHPALVKRFAGTPRLSIPAKDWICGLPAVAEVVERLRAARRDLLDRSGRRSGDGMVLAQ